MTRPREITRDDILPLETYAAKRKDLKRALVEKKKHRRQEVGPVCTFYFENYDTMWAQVHEMLFIERGGEEQITDELAAYNPLIPKGAELVATVMFEIDEPDRRSRFLAKLGGIEETAFFKIGEEVIDGVPRSGCGPNDRGRQGLVGAVPTLSLHRRTDCKISGREYPGHPWLPPSPIQPHGGPAGGCACSPVGRLRLNSAQLMASSG